MSVLNPNLRLASIILNILNDNKFIEFRDKGVISTVCKTWNSVLLNSKFWREIHITKRCSTEESYYVYMQSLYTWILKMNIYLDKINKVVIDQGPKKKCGLFYKVCRNIVSGKNITSLEITDISHVSIIKLCSQTLVELKINIVDKNCDLYNYNCNGECDEICKNNDKSVDEKEILTEEEKNKIKEFDHQNHYDYLDHPDCDCIGKEYQDSYICQRHESTFKNIKRITNVYEDCYSNNHYRTYNAYLLKYSRIFASINELHNTSITFPLLQKYHINLTITTDDFVHNSIVGSNNELLLNINYGLLINAPNLTNLTYDAKNMYLDNLDNQGHYTNNSELFSLIDSTYAKLINFNIKTKDYEINKLADTITNLALLDKQNNVITNTLLNLCSDVKTIDEVVMSCYYCDKKIKSYFQLGNTIINKLIIKCSCGTTVRRGTCKHQTIYGPPKNHTDELSSYIDFNKENIDEVILNQERYSNCGLNDERDVPYLKNCHQCGISNGW